MSESIVVYYGPHILSGTGAPGYHKYIIYTNNNGERFYARGGPGGSGPGLADGYELSSSPFGPIQSEYGPETVDSPDYDDENDNPSETIIEGDDLSQYWQNIKEALDVLNSQQLPYLPLDRNSNSAVDYALREAGLPEPQLDGESDYWSPGSGEMLPLTLDEIIFMLLFLPFPQEERIEALLNLFHAAEITVSPLILDLDGDGVETLSKNSGIYFDHDGNGFAEKTGWVGKDDGLLVWDRNGNGQIDDGSELFGNYVNLVNGQSATNGFAALADLDGNHDGKIDANDAVFTQLRVWKDGNSDAHVGAGELLSLPQANVGSLGINYSEQNLTDAQGNQVLQTGQYTNTDGVTQSMNDVWFSVDTARTKALNLVSISADIASLPEMAGFGNVASLRQAMAQDTSGNLQGLVEQFTEETNVASRKALLDQILFSWSGADQFSIDSRGYYIDDARKLYVLEAFLGRGFIQLYGYNEGTPNPGGASAIKLIQAYNYLASSTYSALMLQTHLKPLLEILSLNFDGTNVEFDVSALVEKFRIDYSENPELGTQIISEFGNSLANVSGIWGADVLASFRQAGDINGTDYSQILASMGTLGSLGDDELHGNVGANFLHGLAGQDIMYGNGGDDILIGGTGDDFLSGDAGSDTYRFSRGWGQDILDNYDTSTGKVDAIEFAADIAPSDIIINRWGNDLILSLNGTDDNIILRDYFYIEDGISSYLLDEIRFANGTTWNTDQVKLLVMVGTDGDDYLVGSTAADILSGGLGYDRIEGDDGNDILEGGAGYDGLRGDAGSDTYRFSRGWGRDSLNNYDTGTDKVDAIEFAADIAPSDIVVARSSSDLILSLSGTTDKITLSNYFDDDGTSSYKLEEIRFADGTTWSIDQVKVKAIAGTEGNDFLVGYATADMLSGGLGYDRIYGNDGNDTLVGGADDDRLYGNNGNDTLDGGVGYDQLSGDAGSDTYRFSRGWGQDNIDNYDTSTGKVDAIEFAAGIAPNDISVVRWYSDLVLSLSGTTDKIYIWGYFDSDGTGICKLEEIRFADGTAWSIDQVKVKAITSTTGNDALYGYATDDQLNGGLGADALYGAGGNDILEGGAGNDALSGDAGSDTYRFSRGWGRDNLNNYDTSTNKVDAIEFAADIAPSDIVVARSYFDLILSLNGTTDKITLSNYFESDGTSNYKLEEIRFADGTTWTIDQVKVKAMTSTTGNDILYGYATDDQLSGGLGADTLHGAGGNDSLEGGAGNDALSGDEGSDTYRFSRGWGQDSLNNYDSSTDKVDAIEFAADIAPSDISVARSFANLILSLNCTTDRITLSNYFNSDGTSNYKLEEIRFADGTTWSIDQVKVKAITSTTGNDTLFGYDTDDQLSGGLGADTLYGAGGNDSLEGGAGNDVLSGDAGSDTYHFSPGWGQDSLNNYDIATESVDTLLFGEGLTAEQLWFRKNGSSLDVSVIGTSDKVSISNWYSGSNYHLDQFKTVDGKGLLDGQVQNLVDAMAAFGVPAGSETSLTSNQRAQLDMVIAANWQ